MIRLLLALLPLFLCAPLQAQARADSVLVRLGIALPASSLVEDAARVAELDRIASALARAEALSDVVLLARGDSVLYERAFGTLDDGTPVETGTRFNLASLVKPWLSVGVARLVEQGKLSWEDSIGRFVPKWPAHTRVVRVKHLVSHTSGLPEIARFPDDARSLEDYLAVSLEAARAPLEYEPGAQTSYRNINFVLLAAIVEILTGSRFDDYVRQSILRPARMERTDYDTAGYPAPFCCAQGTARDLLRFARALQNGELVKPETVEVLFAPKPEAGNWSYGFDVLDAERGLVGHGGSFTNLSHTIDMFTKSGYTAVILTNRTAGRSPLREMIWRIVP